MGVVEVEEQQTEAVVAVENLRTWFNTSRGLVRAVDGVTFSVDRDKTLGIVGESGSGKSMLARSLMGILPRNAVTPSGRVIFDGLDVRERSREEQRRLWGDEISMVFQDPMTSLNPVVKIGRQITESLRHHMGLNRADARIRAIDLLRSVGMPEAEKRFGVYPHELSGGMRQRVSIAIAIACNPRLLIADEPTTALDVTIQRQILDLLTALQREHHMAVILISHDLGVVAGHCDDVAVMYGGQIVEKAPTRMLFNQTRHHYTTALLGAAPRVERSSHTRLEVLSGRPASVIDPSGCRFAPRCKAAQNKCLVEDVPLTTDDKGHQYRCFFPAGTPAGDAALQSNLAAGRTAAGLAITPKETS